MLAERRSAEPGAWGRGPGWRFARALRGHPAAPFVPRPAMGREDEGDRAAAFDNRRAWRQGNRPERYALRPPRRPLRDGLREAQEFAARAAPMRRGLKRPTISLPAGPPFGSWSGPQNTILNFTQPPCAAGSLVGQQDHLRPLHHPMLTGPSTCPLPQHLLFFGSQANRRPVAHEQIMP
jgi:hypothetical protein